MRLRALTLTAVTAGALAVTAVPAQAVTAGEFAPYNDMSNSASLLDTAITQHGVTSFTAAFVIGSGCDEIWGDTLPVGNDPNTDAAISKAKSEGASVIVSSGGAAGEPLAWTCTDQGKIEDGYQKIIDSYGVTSLDFDIEGAAVADQAAAARQMTAMKDLKARNSTLTFSVTLAVLPTGLTQDGVNVVTAAKNAGVKIDNVNIMAMDYYNGTQDMGQAAIQAAQATLGQIKAVDGGYTYADVGITPMIGTNDDNSTFTLADAATVKNWAASNGIGRLAFWSINRDQSCSAFAPHASPTCSGVSQGQLAFADAFA
ncbi:chitinase [Kutzneria sp. NPDC052558]|uniref:chitinase n=1 Tax=Kutzneria sp. NPDC052558 TaxID=3364121 RepID=UPI0037C7FEC0